MKTRIVFSIISVIVALLISLCIPALTSAQQRSQNAITKDIPSMSIDGGGKLTLDVSEDLGFIGNEALKLINALPAKETDGTGVTIELLKPENSTVHSKGLVIRQIKPKLTGKLVEREATGSKFQFEELGKLFNTGSALELHHIVLIELFNTTKSRINLQNWQIRFTYGAMPDATDATMGRLIDRMSNVDEEVWKHREPLKRSLIETVFMSRRMDIERLNDPSKTQGEQLSAISDGTRPTDWDISEVPLEHAWIEVRRSMDGNGKTWQYRIELQGEDGHPRAPKIIIDDRTPLIEDR